MTTRQLVSWIALQTLLGGWFVWLLLAGSPVAPPRADGGEVSRSARTAAPQVASTSVLGEGSHRELATPAAAADPAKDPVGVLLYGRITDEHGNPVDKALLSIRQQSEHQGACQTDARGTYSLARLLPGEAELLVRTPGFRNLSETLQLATSALRHDLVVQRAVVLQVIARTPAGEPLAEVLPAAGVDERIRLDAIATREPLAALPGEVFGIGVGRFRHARWLGRVQIEGASAELLGLLEIDGELPVHVSLIVGAAILQSQVAQPGQERVEFSLTAPSVREHLASIRLQLVAETTGRPLAAMRVEGPDVKITDAEGVAEFVAVVPGQPAPATMSWDHLDGHTFTQPLRDDRSGGTDKQGRWQLRLAPHRYALHAHTEGGAQQAHLLVDLTAAVPEQITLRLQPTVLVELVKQFAASRSFLLSIRSTDGVPVFGSSIRAAFAQSIRLPAGDYVAELHEGRTLVRSFGLTVGSKAAQIRIP